MKRAVLFLIVFTALLLVMVLTILTPVFSAEVGILGRAPGATIKLLDQRGDCPEGLLKAVFVWPPALKRPEVVGCWVEWQGYVRLFFEDFDSGTVPRDKFRLPDGMT